MHVHDLSFVRSGDKGDVSNVVVLAKDEQAYAILEQALIPEAIAAHMGANVTGRIAVYKLPRLAAFNVVMHGALGGGATRTLRWDSTGKSMCAVLSRMPVSTASSPEASPPAQDAVPVNDR